MQAMAAVVEQWKAEGISLASPVAEAAVQRVFAKLGATATSDVVALYSAMGGMHEMDKELWCLWPLDRIEQENTEASLDGVLFADYLIDSWCYRLKNNGDGTSAVLVDPPDGSSPVQVAGSLDAFFEMYTLDAVRLLDPAAAR